MGTYTPKPPTSEIAYSYQVKKNRVLELARALVDHIQEDQKPSKEWYVEFCDLCDEVFFDSLYEKSLFDEWKEEVSVNSCTQKLEGHSEEELKAAADHGHFL